MKHQWFREWGWVYLPVSWQGYLITIAFVIFCVYTFITIDRKSHSVSDTLYGFFPYFIPSLLVLHWIGSNTAKKK